MKLQRKAPFAVMAVAALTLTACAQSDRDTSDSGSDSGDVKDTFTFGAAGAPKLFDPFYATDGETFRVTRQMHSGLLGVTPGTADVEPDLFGQRCANGAIEGFARTQESSRQDQPARFGGAVLDHRHEPLAQFQIRIEVAVGGDIYCEQYDIDSNAWSRKRAQIGCR